jgi:hypothetical protein
MSFFFVSYNKLENRRAKLVLPGMGRGLIPVEEQRNWENDERG